MLGESHCLKIKIQSFCCKATFRILQSVLVNPIAFDALYTLCFVWTILWLYQIFQKLVENYLFLASPILERTFHVMLTLMDSNSILAFDQHFPKMDGIYLALATLLFGWSLLSKMKPGMEFHWRSCILSLKMFPNCCNQCCTDITFYSLTIFTLAQSNWQESN